MTQQQDTLRVELGTRGYDIVIGAGLLARAGEMVHSVVADATQLIVVTDSHLAETHLPALESSLKAVGVPCHSLVMPAGEGSKSFSQLEALVSQLLDLRPDRKVVLVALGGGVIGDLTGFAASILLRGVRFIQIPTTLLAQVDSSVGGKTGINTRHGKNLVGSFYQPQLVLADTEVLATLPPRELRAGYAEVVKYGLIDRPAFFDWLEAEGHRVLAGEPEALRQAILESCRAKAEIVAADEQEHGARALLNLGHTFGHAFETETGYGDVLLHGEAVALGMVLAFDLSVDMGLCPAEDAARVRNVLKAAGLPVSPVELGQVFDADVLCQHMYGDKKAEGGALTFILARGIGQSFVAKDVDAAAVRKRLQSALNAE